MRRIGYPERGPHLPRMAKEWEELVMLTQAALSITNTERRVLDIDRPESIAALRQHVRSVMTEHGCLPSQVIDRLTQQRIRPGD